MSNVNIQYYNEADHINLASATGDLAVPRVGEVIRFEAATSVDYEVVEVVYHIAQGTNLRQRISVFLARIG